MASQQTFYTANATANMAAVRNQFMAGVGAARQQYAVITGTTGTFKTVNHPPRSVCDCRFMGAYADIGELMKAVDRFYMRRGVKPDTVRVHRAVKRRLIQAAGPASGNLLLYGLKVTL